MPVPLARRCRGDHHRVFGLEAQVGKGGFSGSQWIAHGWQEYGARVTTRREMHGPEVAPAQQQHSHWRQIIETVNAALDAVFALPFPGAHTPWGLVSRIAAKLFAFNLGIAINRLFGRPDH